MESHEPTDSEHLAAIGLVNMTAVAESDLGGEEISDSDEPDSINDTGAQAKGSRKRTASFKIKKNRSSMIAIQFPVGDPRNSYAESYFDALNEGDEETVNKMLQNICIADVILAAKYDKSPDSDIIPENLEVRGMVALAAVIVESVRSAPDVVFQILTKQVEVYRNGESVVTVTWTSKGTKLYDINGLKCGVPDKIVVSASSVSMDSVSEGLERMQITSTMVSTVIDPVSGKKVEVRRDEKLGKGVMLDEVRERNFTGTNAFYINKERKVYLIYCDQRKPSKA